MVRDNLADSVELGQVSGVCIEAGGRICAVAAYTIDAQAKICHSQLLAVQTGSYRRTYGLQLKREIMRLAKEAGARAVVSIVHIDNDPMLELNIKLGASVLRIPGDDDYRQCVIPLFSDT